LGLNFFILKVSFIFIKCKFIVKYVLSHHVSSAQGGIGGGVNPVSLGSGGPST